MKRTGMAALACVTMALAGCAGQPPASGAWTTLIDGTRGMENFRQIGGADWAPRDGTIAASHGGKDQSFLVTRDAYRNFVLRAEFWASPDANSGIFVRCQDPARVTDENCYEANIFDQRPDPSYGTGAITKVAKAPVPMPKAGGHWNTYEVRAEGDHLVLVLNGVKTVDVRDAKFAQGPIALQWAAGTIKWRKVEIRPL
jgi:hypothetical protein